VTCAARLFRRCWRFAIIRFLHLNPDYAPARPGVLWRGAVCRRRIAGGSASIQAHGPDRKDRAARASQHGFRNTTEHSAFQPRSAARGHDDHCCRQIGGFAANLFVWIANTRGHLHMNPLSIRDGNHVLVPAAQLLAKCPSAADRKTCLLRHLGQQPWVRSHETVRPARQAAGRNRLRTPPQEPKRQTCRSEPSITTVVRSSCATSPVISPDIASPCAYGAWPPADQDGDRKYQGAKYGRVTGWRATKPSIRRSPAQPRIIPNRRAGPVHSGARTRNTAPPQAATASPPSP
jgi:hypothetical protein